MRAGRILLVVVLTAMGVFGAVGTAFAHAVLESSSPAEGASLAEPPKQVTLTFGEAVTVKDNPITVTGPGGAAWTVGPVTLAGPVVSAPVTPSGPAGSYVLTYQVVSDDGDTVKGSVRFTLTAPAAPAPAAAAPAPAPAVAAAPDQAPASGGGLPVWGWVLIGLGVVAAAALAARARRTRA
jgi:hypothetical protein